MRPPVAMHHRLENLRLQGEHSLHPLRRDIVALVVDDNVLLAVGDDQTPAIVEVADIAGMEPALLQNPRRFRVVAPIAVHHQFAPDTDFTVCGDADHHLHNSLTDRCHPADTDRTGLRYTWCTLCLAIPP